MNCVYKPCPAALYSAVQSHCSILSHDALRHYLSSNSSLENGERELGHLFRYCRSCKNTSTILLGERAYSATGNSRVYYLKSGYVIQLIAFRWDTACIRSSPDPLPTFAEVGRACKTSAAIPRNLTMSFLGIRLKVRPLSMYIVQVPQGKIGSTLLHTLPHG